jgi:hypothetical protein
MENGLPQIGLPSTPFFATLIGVTKFMSLSQGSPLFTHVE